MKYAIIAVVLFASGAFAGEAEVKAFLVGHMELLEKQDVEGAIKNLHSKGKNRAKSEHDLRTKLQSMKFKCKVFEVVYIGRDKEYHYVRYKQHTLFDERWQKMTGAKGIEMDCMTILGEENGKLKIFDTYMFSQKKL